MVKNFQARIAKEIHKGLIAAAFNGSARGSVTVYPTDDPGKVAFSRSMQDGSEVVVIVGLESVGRHAVALYNGTEVVPGVGVVSDSKAESEASGVTTVREAIQAALHLHEEDPKKNSAAKMSKALGVSISAFYRYKRGDLPLTKVRFAGQITAAEKFLEKHSS